MLVVIGGRFQLKDGTNFTNELPDQLIEEQLPVSHHILTSVEMQFCWRVQPPLRLALLLAAIL